MTLDTSTARETGREPDVRDSVEGGLVDLDGRRFYRIVGYDAMDPFFMTIVGSSDVWLFVSSSGGLTAGRVDAQRALFPYYTEDKVSESAGRTGGLSMLRVAGPDRSVTYWQPFADRRPGDPAVERALYKDVLGSTLVFEETRPDLRLRLRVTWQTSARFGVVRSCELTSLADEVREVEMLDGLVNVLPAGVSVAVQNELSILLDAYKRSGTCRSPSAAATATPAAPGTASRSTSAWSTPTAGRGSTTRATGATSSRTGRRWPTRSPARVRDRDDRRLPRRDHRRRLQPLPRHARRHRVGGPRAGQPLVQHRLLERPPGRLPAEAAGDAARFDPGALDALLDRRVFSHANVPYRIRPTPPCSTTPTTRSSSTPPRPPHRGGVATRAPTPGCSKGTRRRGPATSRWPRSCCCCCSSSWPTSCPRAASG
jgi:hypothetical protein